MIFRQLIDRESSTYTYLLADERTREAVLIDPVREQLGRDIQLLGELGLTLRYVLETHVHADHVTSAGTLRERLGAQTVLGAAAGAGCPDHLIQHGDTLEIGSLTIEARHTPGHTAGCVTYVLHDGAARVAFTGDALMIRGCGRTDFQQGDAGQLYDSVWNQIFTLDDKTLIYPGHDYRGQTVTTVGEEKALNPRLGGGKTKAEFKEIMQNLDLAKPAMITVAVPANMQCGLPQDDPWAAVEYTRDGVPEVDVGWVRAHREEVLCIDVRGPAELRGELGAMPGARNVPMNRVPAEMVAWAPDQPIVVLCRSGGRSASVARLMVKAGFARVASMRGGMMAWRTRPVTAASEQAAPNREQVCG